MFGAYGKALPATCITFVSKGLAHQKHCAAVRLAEAGAAGGNCRNISKKDLVHNDATPLIEVNPENYEVKVDGAPITCQPVAVVPRRNVIFYF